MKPELAAKVHEAEQAIWTALGPQKEDDRPRLGSGDLLRDLERTSQERSTVDFWADRVAARLALGGLVRDRVPAARALHAGLPV